MCQAQDCFAQAAVGWQRHATDQERQTYLLAQATRRVELLRAQIERAHTMRLGQQDAAVQTLVAEARRTGLPVPRELAVRPPAPQLPSLETLAADPDTGQPILIQVHACPHHAIDLDEAALVHQDNCHAPHADGCDCTPTSHHQEHPDPPESKMVTLPTGWRIPENLLTQHPTESRQPPLPVPPHHPAIEPSTSRSLAIPTLMPDPEVT